jgi:sugar lactone lactonase YvrE
MARLSFLLIVTVHLFSMASSYSAGYPIESLDSYQPPRYPEGLTVGQDGSAYVGMIRTGEILRYPPDFELGQPTPTPLATLPVGPEFADGLAGLAIDADDRVYAGLAAITNPADQGIWRIEPDGTTALFASMPANSLPNGVLWEPSDQSLYVADSAGGRIFRIPAGDAPQTPELWAEGSLLQGDGSLGAGIPFGANGLTIVGSDMFVTNTEKGLIVRVPIESDGTAGVAEIAAEGPLLGGADGLTADVDGNLYVANIGQSTLLRVESNGIEILADATDGVDGPSSLEFGPDGRTDLYFVNYAPRNPNPQLGLLKATIPEPSAFAMATFSWLVLLCHLRRNSRAITIS